MAKFISAQNAQQFLMPLRAMQVIPKSTQKNQAQKNPTGPQNPNPPQNTSQKNEYINKPDIPNTFSNDNVPISNYLPIKLHGKLSDSSIILHIPYPHANNYQHFSIHYIYIFHVSHNIIPYIY